MIYNILLHFIVFLATRHIIIEDLAFSSPQNDPPRGANGIHKGVSNERHCLLKGKVEEKDYNTDIKEVMIHHTQYESQHGKNKQEIKRDRVWHWKGCVKQYSKELEKKVPIRQYVNQQ